MVKPIPLPATFQERLDSFNNPSLWENLSYDGDGEWIQEGLLRALLCIRGGTDKIIKKKY
jgi:hypothetical protein